MDFETYIVLHDRFDRSGVRDYIKDVIQKDKHILFYNKDFKEWMVQERRSGKRRFLVIVYTYEDNMHCTEFLLRSIPHPTPLLKTLYEIEDIEEKNRVTHDCWYEHIPDWSHYLNMVYMDVYCKQIIEILKHKDLPQNIIDKTLSLQQSVLDYIEKNKTTDYDKDRIELDSINARLYEIVKNICSLTHYIIVSS